MYPDVEATAIAAVIVFPEPYGSLTNGRGSIHPSDNNIKNIVQNIKFPVAKTAVEDTLRIWVFIYYSDDAEQEIVILLNIETGSPVEFPGPSGEETTAEENINSADGAAISWAGDASLVLVGNFAELTEQGMALFWSYVYYSPSKDSVRVFFYNVGIRNGF